MNEEYKPGDLVEIKYADYLVHVVDPNNNIAIVLHASRGLYECYYLYFISSGIYRNLHVEHFKKLK